MKQALPSNEERKSAEEDRDKAVAILRRIDKEISRIGDAVASGADLLIEKHNDLKAEKERAVQRLTEAEALLERMPDPKLLQQQVTAMRLQLLKQVKRRDWRKLPNEEIRRFLIFLFGDNPGKSGHGITLFREEGRWRISFKGIVEFYHELSDGRPLSHAVKKAAAHHNSAVTRRMRERVNLTGQT